MVWEWVGGTVLIMCLTLFLGVDQHLAQAANLIFFIPTSITAIFINSKQKLIDYKASIPIILFGIIGAIVGAKIALNLNVQNLRKYFGLFLLFIAIWEIYSIFKKVYKKEKNT